VPVAITFTSIGRTVFRAGFAILQPPDESGTVNFSQGGCVVEREEDEQLGRGKQILCEDDNKKGKGKC